jgi:cAMP phosphodiesterase
MPEHPFDNGELKIRDEMLAPHPRTTDPMRKHIADYYACITNLDHEIGRIIAYLATMATQESKRQSMSAPRLCKKPCSILKRERRQSSRSFSTCR